MPATLDFLSISGEDELAQGARLQSTALGLGHPCFFEAFILRTQDTEKANRALGTAPQMAQVIMPRTSLDKDAEAANPFLLTSALGSPKPMGRERSPAYLQRADGQRA